MEAHLPNLPSEVAIPYTPWVNRNLRVGQAFVHHSTADIRVVLAGRQSGKSMTGIAEISHWAMSAPNQILWWVTASLKTKDKAWRDLKAHIPKDIVAKTHEVDLRIELGNGSIIKIRSAEAPESFVSESLDGVVCDEFGQWKPGIWYQGLMPMFGTKKMRALFIGTPRGKNWAHDLYKRGRAADGSALAFPVVFAEEVALPSGPVKVETTYQSFRWTSYDSPYANLAVLEEARRSTPKDIFAQEYMAEALDNSSGVFSKVRERVMFQPAQADQYTVVGADFARKRDYSCFIPMNSRRQAISVVRTQEDWPVQQQRLAHLAISNNFARIVGDEASPGDPVIQGLRVAGLQVEGVNTNGSLKRTLIEGLRLAFEQGTISIPNDETLIDELESYEYEVLPSGQLHYGAPSGKHDDTVIALALALWGQRASIYAYADPGHQTSSYMGRSSSGSYLRRAG